MQKRKQYEAESQEIVEILNKLYSQFGKYALPEQEARKIIDQALGTKSLTEALEHMREG